MTTRPTLEDLTRELELTLVVVEPDVETDADLEHEHWTWTTDPSALERWSPTTPKGDPS
jgi:hypothetical protein